MQKNSFLEEKSNQFTSVQSPGSWDEVAVLLNERQYNHMAKVIQETRKVSEKRGDDLMVGLLEAIYQICLTAKQCLDDIQHSKKSYEQAVRREAKVRKQLRNILTPLMGDKDFDGEDQQIHFPNETKYSEENEIDSSIKIRADLVIYCLGRFQVLHDNKPIRHGLNGKGSAILKYMAVNRKYPVAKEVLMELFWPDSNPDAARNNLNVAIYSLRQALRSVRPDFSHILFQDDRYLFNPELDIWVDAEEFMDRFRLAQKLERQKNIDAAIREYQVAEILYQGNFLEEDRYEDWVRPNRQHMKDSYLILLERISSYYLDQNRYDICASICRKIIEVEPGREDIHQRLMLCYKNQDQRYLALRQFHLCVEALSNEFDTGPSQSTLEIYEKIRQL